MYVHVRFAGLFHDTLAGCSDGLEMYVHASLVRLQETPDPLPPVLLSVLAVRWWDYVSNTTWSDYSVTSDGLHRDLVDGRYGVFPALAGEFEMYTAFVRHSAELERISEHWAQAVLHGRNAVAWYFLWPQQSARAEETAGCVGERQLFELCGRMERVGVPSGWPHPASLYRQLSGKLWLPSMSLGREFRVPPTTRVQVADARRDARGAAERALEALLRLRRGVWGGPAPAPGELRELRGVAKLGFSWQGDDVLPFRGAENLGRVLARLLLERRHGEHCLCLVQELVPEVLCEYRVLCFHDAARGRYKREGLWLKLKARGEHHKHQSACEVQDFALTSAHVLSDQRAAELVFGGDWRALAEARDAAEALVDRWLLWFAAECADPVPVTRLDFLISRHGENGGPAAWTCEVGECGASLCSVECDARNCAVLNWAVRSDPSGRFPVALPSIARNSGWKS